MNVCSKCGEELCSCCGRCANVDCDKFGCSEIVNDVLDDRDLPPDDDGIPDDME